MKSKLVIIEYQKANIRFVLEGVFKGSVTTISEGWVTHYYLML